jgi:hypothetical protein
MKRQRGRGRKPSGGSSNRSFESNGPDIKVRGSASTIYEKYQQLARDATSSGDRVMAESYLQHAEHYFRIMRAQQAAQREREEQNAPRDSDGRDRDRASSDSGNGSSGEAAASDPMSVVDPEARQKAADQKGKSGDEGEESPAPRRGRRPRRSRSAEPSGDASEALEAAGEKDAADAADAATGA